MRIEIGFVGIQRAQQFEYRIGGCGHLHLRWADQPGPFPAPIGLRNRSSVAILLCINPGA